MTQIPPQEILKENPGESPEENPSQVEQLEVSALDEAEKVRKESREQWMALAKEIALNQAA
jgi:hypothetical protein